MRLQPDWVNELATDWARGDKKDVSEALGYPRECPSFRGSSSSWDEDVTGYSHAEVRAMAAAIEWLRLVHPEHWRALARHLRPHMRRELPERSGDTQLLVEVGPMLAEYIDNVLG